MRKAIATMLAAALLLTFLVGGLWSGAQAAGSGQGDRVAAEKQLGDEGGPADNQGASAARPHPRGLPRAGKREPGPRG